jgi:hypothetical protein
VRVPLGLGGSSQYKHVATRRHAVERQRLPLQVRHVVQGLTKDGAVAPKGKTLLKDALVQVILTENTVNTNWPPVPAEG